MVNIKKFFAFNPINNQQEAEKRIKRCSYIFVAIIALQLFAYFFTPYYYKLITDRELNVNEIVKVKVMLTSFTVLILTILLWKYKTKVIAAVLFILFLVITFNTLVYSRGRGIFLALAGLITSFEALRATNVLQTIKKVKTLDVKFNFVRWIIFFVAIFIGWLIALAFSLERPYRIVLGTIFAMFVYFYFYFKDKKVAKLRK